MKPQIILKSILFSLSVFVSGAALAQEGSGNVITQERTPGSFTGVNLDGRFTYHIAQGATDAVKIETDENLQENIKTSLSGGTLTFNIKEGDFTKLEITIICKDLQNLRATSSCEVYSDNRITSNNLTITASGAVILKMEVAVQKLETNLSGAADAELSGTAAFHNITTSGAAYLKSTNLETGNTFIKASGAADAKLNVVDSLTGSASGASHIKYKPKPKYVNLAISGAASVNEKSADAMTIENNVDIETEVAYNDVKDSDTTKITMGNKNITITDNDDKDKEHHKSKKSDKPKAQWAGVAVGVNGYMNHNNGFSMPNGYSALEPDYGRSWFVDLNPVSFRIPIVRKHLGLVTGLGVEFNNYRFTDKHNYLTPDTNYTSFTYDSTRTFTKSKLTAVFLQVPLMLQFDTKKLHKKNTFHVSAGVVGSLKIGSYTKQVTEIDGTKFKPRTKDDFNLNQFRYSAMVRIGYGWFDIFASYSLNTLFKKNQGPELYPVTVGIALLNI
jgi:hypothetical protein